MWLFHILFSLLFFIYNVSAFNILAIISLPLHSHYMAFKNLFHELAARGHSVTVINNFPQQNASNLRYINLGDRLNHNFTTLENYANWHPWVLHLKNFKDHYVLGGPSVTHECEVLFTNPNAKAHLEEGNKYDVIFVEQFLSDCALAYAGTHFNAPIIGITSHVLLPWTTSQLGIPTDLASDIFYFSTSKPSECFLSKIESFLMNLFIYTYSKPHVFHKNIYDCFDKYMPKVPLDVDFIAKNRMKMVFAYQHYSMTGARLLAPQLLEIAGLHVTKPKSVSEEIEEFLSDAKHGAIYVSFGSNLKLSSMTPRMLQVFLEAFKLLPQKILLKWEEDDFPAGHENVLRRKWFPQIDVLCHPKVLAFVSHGGMLSTAESVHCGKPILMMPLFGDQFHNAASARAVGYGKTLAFATVTTENLARNIEELTSSEMQQNAQRVSKLFHDRPLSVLDSAIYWTEFVARHGTSPPSLASKHTSLFESLLLDVISILIIVLLLLIWIICAVLKLIRYILCSLLGLCFSRKKEKRH